MNEPLAVIRTPEQIITRINGITDDFFGKRHEVLIGALRYEDAKPFLLPSVSAEKFDEVASKTPWEVAASYLEFAIGKAEDHRGLSASRSTDGYSEWVWLMSDRFDEYEAADYSQYGMPQVKKAAEILGLDWDGLAGAKAKRMAEGLPCDPDGCWDGCNT